jgi:D-alanine-D-alanine ligase
MRIAVTFNLKNDNSEKHRNSMQCIQNAINVLGYSCVLLEASNIEYLVSNLTRGKIDLIFNMCEGFTGKYREAFYPLLFEQLNIKYTHSGFNAQRICQDKFKTILKLY